MMKESPFEKLDSAHKRVKRCGEVAGTCRPEKANREETVSMVHEDRKTKTIPRSRWVFRDTEAHDSPLCS